MFNNAAAYERFMGQWSAHLARLFAGFALAPGNGRVLDVGCGTGSMIQAIRDRDPGTAIVGIDPSPEFVGYSRSRFPDKQHHARPGQRVRPPLSRRCLRQLGCVPGISSDPGARGRPHWKCAGSRGQEASLPLAPGTSPHWKGRPSSGKSRSSSIRRRRRSRRPRRYCSRDGELTSVWKHAGLEKIQETDLSHDDELRILR